MRSTIIDGDTIFVQEAIGDKMYSYEMVHSDVVIQEMRLHTRRRGIVKKVHRLLWTRRK
jgi:hypothetical protein